MLEYSPPEVARGKAVSVHEGITVAADMARDRGWDIELFTGLSHEDLLHELERETHLRTLSPQMVCGKVQGHLLTLLTTLARPLLALEIGTFTGYASLCIAKGLPEGGVLHTVEINPELAHISQKYFAKAGLADKIVAHLGDAKAVVPRLGLRFGLVFMDAAKFDYPAYYEMVVDMLNPGGPCGEISVHTSTVPSATGPNFHTPDVFVKFVGVWIQRERPREKSQPAISAPPMSGW